MPEETIDFGDNPTGATPTPDQITQIRSTLQAQPLSDALTAFGEEIERSVVSGTLDLTETEADIISVDPVAELTIDALYLPTGCSRVTLRFLGAIYFGPVGVDVESGDVMVVTEIDGSFRIASHMRSNGSLPIPASYTFTSVTADTFIETASNIASGTGSTGNVSNSENGKTSSVTGTSAVVRTVPSGLTAGFCTDYWNDTTGAGSLTITAGASVSFNGISTNSFTVSRGCGCRIKYIGSNSYKTTLVRPTTDIDTKIMASSAQNVTNSTTYADSTELQISLTPGTYIVETLELIGSSAYATAGAKSRLLFTGSGTFTGTRMRAGASATEPINSALSWGGSGESVDGETAWPSSSSMVQRNGTLVVTSSGIIKVQFAQTTAIAANTATLMVGSYLRVKTIR